MIVQLKQLAEYKGALAVLLTAFVLGAAFVTYLDVPDRLAAVEDRSEANEESIEDHRREFDEFLTRFDELICIQRAEADGAPAGRCIESVR